MSGIAELKKIIDASDNIVFFGGAGVPTESGIPDFRGGGGLYSEDEDDGVPPETKLSRGYFLSCPEGFYKYYRRHMLYPDAQPNRAHLALAALERAGKLRAVITQNIDGLHQRAGSKNVIELHGSTLENYCVDCGRRYDIGYILNSAHVPKCSECGGTVRPDVVLYGEGLDDGAFSDAARAIENAEVLIVGGTSLTVNPAASLVGCYSGKHLIIINKTPTIYDLFAEMVLRDPIGEVLGRATDSL